MCRRQPEAIFVIALLDRGGQNALDANAIAAHDGHDFFAIFIEHARTHGLGVLVTQLEDVADFNCGIDTQRRTAIRAGLACGHTAQVGVGRGLESLARRDVLDVVVLFVGSRNQVFAAFESLIAPAGWGGRRR